MHLNSTSATLNWHGGQRSLSSAMFGNGINGLMDESDAGSAVPSRYPATRIVANSAADQGTYVSAAPVVKRYRAEQSGNHSMAASSMTPSRCLPITRIITHHAGIPMYQYTPAKRSVPYDCDLQLVRKFPRTTDKSKGLRHFSTKVCEKVKEKGHTNYNEVADELVAEYFDSADVSPGDTEKQQYDMKNIRRRVYDALNVLMAMNIIEKEKKEIRWVGLPTSSVQECRKLEEEKARRQERIRQKADQLHELIIQLVAYKTLVEKNRELERENGRPREDAMLYLPFIIVNTAKKTFIDCAISHDKTEYLFNFDQPFEIHDDIEVLKRLGLAYGLERGEVSYSDRQKIKSLLPVTLREYVDQIIDGTWNNPGYDIGVTLPSNSTSPKDNKETVYTIVPRHGSPGSLAMRQSTTNIPQGYMQKRLPLTAATRVIQPVLPRIVSAASSAVHTGAHSNFVAASSNGYRAVRAPMHHYTVHQSAGSTQQRIYTPSRQATYIIQNAGQGHLPSQQQQHYEEVYEEEENLGYE